MSLGSDFCATPLDQAGVLGPGAHEQPRLEAPERDGDIGRAAVEDLFGRGADGAEHRPQPHLRVRGEDFLTDEGHARRRLGRGGNGG